VPLTYCSDFRYSVKVLNQPKIYQNGAAASFIDEKLETGIVSFSLDELTSATGLSVIAAKNQLLRLGDKVVRVTPRQQYFLIVAPEHRIIGAPPVAWWLDDYFKWLGHPYYFGLMSAATVHGSSPQAIQETQVVTDTPRRTITVGRIRIRFFMKSGIGRTITQQLPYAYAPLFISTPETTIYDLVRYEQRIGGLERVAETIAPLLPAIKTSKLVQVLKAEREIVTAGRLGFVLETVGAHKLAKAARGVIKTT
jgi:AbiEi antitoxin C-terminal domain